MNATPSPCDAGTQQSTASVDEQYACDQLPQGSWFDPVDEAHVLQQRAVAARRRAYETEAHTLWRDVKAALAETMAAYSQRKDDPIECGETPTGGFAATRFRRPLALVDVGLDTDNGVIACVYSFGECDQAPYGESVRILLVTASEAAVCLANQEGRRLATCRDAAEDLLTPFIAGLTRTQLEQGSVPQ